MNHEVIETRTAKYWLEEDGILRATPLASSEGTLEEARAILAAFSQLCGDRKRPILGQMGSMNSASRAARELLARETVRYISAAALLVKSPVSRMFASFFLGLNKPPFPVQIFTDEAQAIKWLEEFLE